MSIGSSLFDVFNPLLNALGVVLSLFYSVIPNLGVSIILLTFTIMLVLYPLTAKQAKSMIRMQMVQPEIKRIQAKYKNDRAKLNEEMMAFYQENKINPLAGCLPLLIQMPIFFALFRTLRDTYKHVPTSSKLYAALCTPPNAGSPVGVKACAPNGAYGSSLPVHQKFLGMDLSVTATHQVTTWASFLAFALVVAVMFSGYMQSRQAQKRTPAVNKQMAMVTKVLPVFFGFISLNFPSGLVVYFFVSNLWRLAQQEVIFRHIGTAADPKHRSLQSPTKSSAVDVESRERTEAAAPAELDAAPGKVPSPPKNGSGGSPKRTVPRNAPPSGKAIVPPGRGGGGLRALFQPPPPPDPSAAKAPAKPGAGPTAKPTAKRGAKTSTKASASPTERPGQAGRRTSKKKRKR